MRVFAAVVLLSILGFASLVAYFTFVVSPREQAAQEQARRDAVAFARLHGSARRLAIFDAFVDRIDTHYYDQRFSRYAWKAMHTMWRPKAAGARDDTHLYFDVLFPLSGVACKR